MLLQFESPSASGPSLNCSVTAVMHNAKEGDHQNDHEGVRDGAVTLVYTKFTDSHNSGKGGGAIQFSSIRKSQYTATVNLPHNSSTKYENNDKSTLSSVRSEYSAPLDHQSLYGHEASTQTTQTVAAILTPVTDLQNKDYIEEVRTIIFNKTFLPYESGAQENVATVYLTKIVTIQYGSESDDYDETQDQDLATGSAPSTYETYIVSRTVSDRTSQYMQEVLDYTEVINLPDSVETLTVKALTKTFVRKKSVLESSMNVREAADFRSTPGL